MIEMKEKTLTEPGMAEEGLAEEVAAWIGMDWADDEHKICGNCIAG